MTAQWPAPAGLHTSSPQLPVTEPRLHQLIRHPGPGTDATFEITFADPGAQAYVFTFG